MQGQALECPGLCSSIWRIYWRSLSGDGSLSNGFWHLRNFWFIKKYDCGDNTGFSSEIAVKWYLAIKIVHSVRIYACVYIYRKCCACVYIYRKCCACVCICAEIKINNQERVNEEEFDV